MPITNLGMFLVTSSNTFTALTREKEQICQPQIILPKPLVAASVPFGQLKKLGKKNWGWYTISLSLASTVMLDVFLAS